ncbi:MAG: hypothetical protein ACYC9X_09115 [Dehalococcoidia bacterium]
MALLAVLLFNLSFVAQLERGDPGHADLPLAASCHGGGAGCAAQPLIPPPAVGLPHFDPVAPAHSVLVRIAPPALKAILEPLPFTLDPPPQPATV